MGVSQSSLARLQLVQNAAARLLTRVKKHQHITPVLASLHWLPVRFRIKFKILLLTYKVLNGQAPDYLSDLVQLYTPSGALRSSDHLLLTLHKSRMVHRGDRALRLWHRKCGTIYLSTLERPQLLLFLNRILKHIFLLWLSKL